jgi:hypothetical protein
MGLQEEIDKTRAEIRTDGYSVSIGEWISIYEKGELDIHPEFQRYFRWSPKQKSRLVESILLGIPIPPIFVAQRPDGVWDVVDGLQRLSTIYEFVGLLKDENNRRLPALTLESTQYLPSLDGKRWEDGGNRRNAFTPAQQLLVKRSKIDVSIILKESDESAKYELFQRLNTGGTMLSDQEVRNSILVMLNKDLYVWMRTLATDPTFVSCAALSDKAIQEQYDMELILRFLVFRRMPKDSLSGLGDIGDFLTERATELARKKNIPYKEEEEAFRTTFAILDEQLASDSFRRYDSGKARFVGGFSVSAFEAIAIGIGFNPRKIKPKAAQIRARAQQMWDDPTFAENSGSGVSASSRVPKIIPYGRARFAR